MKSAKMLVLSLFRLFALAAVLFVFSTPVFAYDEDTHFIMTYVICRSVGFSPDEAMIVAAADQGMDDSSNTIANMGPFPNGPAEWWWHALDREGKMEAIGVYNRKASLYRQVFTEKSMRNKLIRLGVFFHYQQDTWSHRHHYDGPTGGGFPGGKAKWEPNRLTKTNYITYDTPYGHVAVGHQPDRPPFDPAAALACLEEGIGYANGFLREAFRRKPNPFLNDYLPKGGNDDGNWSGRDTYVHQISLAGAAPDSPHLYLLSLIREQIDAYEYSNSEMMFLTHKAASEAELDKVRDKLTSVWNKFRNVGSWNKSVFPDLNIPTKKQKEEQGFEGLTSGLLNAPRLPDAPQFIGVGTDKLLWTKNILDSPWLPAPKFGLVTAVAVMNDGTILGVGADHKFYKRKSLKDNWINAVSFPMVNNVAVMPDGAILAVTMANDLTMTDNSSSARQKPPLERKWVRVVNSENILAASAMPNGTLLAVGTDFGLYKISWEGSAVLSKQREPIPGEVSSSGVFNVNLALIGITALEDGTFLGVSKFNVLYKRANLDKNTLWEPVDNNFKLTSIAETPLLK